MQRLEGSGAVRPIYGSLGVKRLRWFVPRAVHVRLAVDNVAVGRGFLPVSPCQYQSTNAPSSSSSTRCSYMKNKRLNLATFKKAMFLWKWHFSSP